jgi:NitT/TauT family transport system substrate-binding protein
MDTVQTRRHVLTGLAAVGLVPLFSRREAFAKEAPLEITSVRFARSPGICLAPQFVAEELIRADGFSDFRYVDTQASLSSIALAARGDVDFVVEYGTALAIRIDQGDPIKVLSGVHVGCYELFAHEGINSVLDLKGKSVAVGVARGSDPHVYVSAMASHVGLDPLKDIDWVTSDVNPMELFAQHKVDAFLAQPPEPQELRARKIGHVILNSLQDRPWSQYFCCMLAANAAYAAKYPAATKRVLRAVLKANDLCVSEPERVARLLISDGYATHYDLALQTLRDIPYAKWRELDPEDTIRFFSLRLREGGMIKSSPQKIIATGTDWRFLNEIKRELKT